jgi:hypothetical protein
MALCVLFFMLLSMTGASMDTLSFANVLTLRNFNDSVIIDC